MKYSAIVLAAGEGSRAGLSKNKALAPLYGVPVLCYSLSAFAEAEEVIVVGREAEENEIKKLLAPFANARLVFGGKTRGESVYAGLKEVKEEIVLIHDAARPFVSKRLINDCVESAARHRSGIAAIPVTDTIVRSFSGDLITDTLARDTLYALQTPQAFKTARILSAYERCIQENALSLFTDDSGVYNAFCSTTSLVKGDRRNIKLTFPEDFGMPSRVGFGVDTHRFEGKEDKALPFIGFIVMGGVKIPSEKRIVAHSDGDVLIHALMDALLSAAGLRDIGYYFPDSDEKYAGADSMELLKEVVKLLKEEGLKAHNISLSILAETPRLAPYIEEMKGNIASALTLSPDAIGIAAGTNEKLGYIGEGKGITCYAYVTVE